MSMKKLKMMMACLVIFAMVFAFTACATTLDGKYTTKDGLIEQSFTFKDDNKVQVSAFGIDVEGEYAIEDDQITITYSLFGLSYDWVKSFEQDGDTITIDGTEFVKE